MYSTNTTNTSTCGLRLDDQYIPIAPVWWVIFSTIVLYILNLWVPLATPAIKKYIKWVCNRFCGCCRCYDKSGNQGHDDQDNDDQDHDFQEFSGGYQDVKPAKATWFFFLQYVMHAIHFVYLCMNLPAGTGWHKYQWLYLSFLHTGFPALYNIVSEDDAFYFVVGFCMVFPPTVTHVFPGCVVFFIPFVAILCGSLIICTLTIVPILWIVEKTTSETEPKFKKIWYTIFRMVFVLLVYQFMFDAMLLVYEDGFVWHYMYKFDIQKEEFKLRSTSCYFNMIKTSVMGGISKIGLWF